MTKEAVVFLADLHANSTLALCKPGIYRDDGEVYSLNLIQQWLWRTWGRCLDDIDSLTTGYYRTLILAGDLVDLDTKHRSWQTISRNPATAIDISISILEPVASKYNDVFVVRGTEAHTGKSAWAEEQIAVMLGATPSPTTSTRSWWHLRARFSGVYFDIAHHASMGGLAWTYANAANKLAMVTMIDHMNWEEKPPDVVVRAHNHQFADSGRTFRTRAVFLPAWQFHTAYLHRIGKANARPHIGACVFLCEDGEYKLHDLRYRPPRNEPWQREQSQKKR